MGKRAECCLAGRREEEERRRGHDLHHGQLRLRAAGVRRRGAVLAADHALAPPRPGGAPAPAVRACSGPA